MTNDELVAYYKGLLLIQYSQKPKAQGTIDALVRPVIMDQLPTQVQNAFSLETAVGVQLDKIGKYAGVTRSGYNFADVYIALGDADFRQLIKFAIMKNNHGSSMYDIENEVNIFFPGAFLVFDYTNMHMGYMFDISIGSSDLAEMVAVQGLLPRPMAVGVGSLIYIAFLTSVFGFADYDLPGPAYAFNTTGFNAFPDYVVPDYTLTTPWIGYEDAIIF